MLVVRALAGVARLAGSVAVPLRAPLPPQGHAYAGLRDAIARFLALHAGIGWLLVTYAFARALRAVDPIALTPWWTAVALFAAIPVAVLYGPVLEAGS